MKILVIIPLLVLSMLTTTKHSSTLEDTSKSNDEFYSVESDISKALQGVVKDSLFKGDDRYKSMMNVPYAQGGETFTMKSEIIDKGGYKAPVFEAKVKKDIILYDQPKDLMARENAQISVEEVNGPEIRVGSLTDVSTNGNWPPIYDKKGDQ